MNFLQMSFESGQLSPALGLPMPFVQSAPLVGFILASIRSFQQIYLDVKKIMKSGEKEAEAGKE